MKKYFRLFLVALLSFSACIIWGCGDGEVTIDYDGGTYSGQLANGIPEGYGTWEHKNGKTYKGEYKDGNFHGQGILTYKGISADERYYTEEYNYTVNYLGEFKNGSKHGHGIYTLIYDNWKDLVETSDARYYLENIKYAGEWENGQWHGQGMYVSKGISIDGARTIRYAGEYKNGVEHGQGAYTVTYGVGWDTNTAEWKNGQLTYDNSHMRGAYVGEWKDGQWHGQGILDMIHDHKYAGEFKYDKEHGLGISIFLGDVQKGRWEEGSLVRD